MSIDRVAAFNDLQLYGMAEALTEWLAEQTRHKLTPEAVINRLINAEQNYRRARSLSYQVKAAKFPIHRDFLSFNWQESPVSQAQIEQLANAAFMDQAYNLIFVGGTGTGKTHLATAIGVAAIHQGKRVRFFNAVDLVYLLDQEKQLAKSGSLAKRLSQIDTQRAQVPSLSMNWAICLFQNPAGLCCST